VQKEKTWERAQQEEERAQIIRAIMDRKENKGYEREDNG